MDGTGDDAGVATTTGTCTPHAIFACCPMCDGPLTPEHAHYKCRQCGWRDSCCD